MAGKSLRKNRFTILATCVLALLNGGLLLPASGVTFDQYWDGTTTSGSGILTGAGGSGTWDNITSNWVNVGGTNPHPYDSNLTTVFSNIGGTVTLGEDIAVMSLRFDANGYTIGSESEPFELVLGVMAPFQTASGVSVAINSRIVGSGGLTFLGSGTATLTGFNTYSGGTILSSGTLNVNSYSALGMGTLMINGGTIGTTVAVGSGVDNAVSVGGDFSVATNSDPASPGNQNLFFNGVFDLGSQHRTITGVTAGGQVSFGNTIMGSAGVTLTTAPSVDSDPNSPYVAFIYGSGFNPNSYTGTTTVAGHAFLVFEGTTPDGAIHGDVDVEENGSLDYVYGGSGMGPSGQIIDTATVTVNSPGNTIAGPYHFAGFELRNEVERIGALKGTGTVGLGSGTLTVGAGDFSGAIGDGDFGVGGNLVKDRPGTLTLSGTNTYTGATIVTAGTLVVNGTIASSSGVSVASGAKLSGHGQVSKISGAGLVAPGDPQILTATQVDPSEGLDFAFSFAKPGAPIFGNAANSGNDILHLTDATPFVFSLTAANTITLDFSGANLLAGETFLGGFFTDASISDSTFQDANFVFTGLNGAVVQYEGLVNEPLTGFATGSVQNGKVMEFRVISSAVPEPSAGIFLLGALGILANSRRFARRRNS